MTTDDNQQQQRRPTTMTNNDTDWVINKQQSNESWCLLLTSEIWNWWKTTTDDDNDQQRRQWWTQRTNDDDRQRRAMTTATTNKEDKQQQQWAMQFECLWQNCKLTLEFLCRQYEFLHVFFCPAISKVPTPNHDVRHSLVTAKDCITPDWCPHTLQTSSTHAWEQCLHFLHPIHIYFWSCITDKITRKMVHFVRHFLCSCGSPECPLRIGITPQYFTDIFQTCMWTILHT